MGVWAVDVDLGKQWKRDTEARFAELPDLVFGAGFLGAELVAWQPEHREDPEWCTCAARLRGQCTGA